MNKITKKWVLDRMRLSIDGSTDEVGYAVFKGKERIISGTYKASSGSTEKRIESVRFFIDSLIKEYKIDEMVLEDIQLQYRNRIPQVHVYRALAMVRGVLVNTAYRNNVSIFYICPSEWRSILGIKGNSKREDSKQSAIDFIRKFTDKEMFIDEIEAICIGMAFIIYRENGDKK